MNLSRLLSFTCIILGGVIAIYAQAEEAQNTYLLILGIVILMIGVYTISRRIPSKYDSIEDQSMQNDDAERKN